MKRSILIILLSTVLLLSCKTTQYVPVETVRIEYKDKLQRDSIYVKDSVLIRQNGDSIFVYKYRYIYKDRTIRDSILKTDSIPVPYPIKGDTIFVEKELTKFQKVCVWSGAIAWIALIASVLIWVNKKTSWLSIAFKFIKALFNK